jgi:hypothetical protein
VSDLEFGVQYSNGVVEGETTNLDDAISELLWAMDLREIASLQELREARRFFGPQIVVRDFDDEDPVLWATLDISDEELYDAARELQGEVD